jgi:hypothetical protein
MLEPFKQAWHAPTKQRKNYTILGLAKGRGEIEFWTVEEKVLPLKDDGLGGGILVKADLLCG